SLAECFVLSRRAALAALDEPATAPAEPRPAPIGAPPSEATRAALWRDAGLLRDAAGLTALLDDPFPLARLIAASALAREESRGAHQRADRPATDPALDRIHTVVDVAGAVTHERWE